jgi:hypothetical protein
MELASIPNSSYDMLIRERIRKQNQKLLPASKESEIEEKKVKKENLS